MGGRLPEEEDSGDNAQPMTPPPRRKRSVVKEGAEWATQPGAVAVAGKTAEPPKAANIIDCDDLAFHRRRQEEKSKSTRQPAPTVSVDVDPNANEGDPALRKGMPEEEGETSWQPTPLAKSLNSKQGKIIDCDDPAYRNRRPEEEGETSWQPTAKPARLNSAESICNDQKTLARSMKGESQSDPNQGSFVPETNPPLAPPSPGRPGAYAGAPGQELQRSDRLRFSLVGAPSSILALLEEGLSKEFESVANEASNKFTVPEEPTRNQDDEENSGLAIAKPALRPSQLPAAMEVDAAAVVRQEKNTVGRKTIICVVALLLIVVVVVVVVVSLATRSGGSDTEELTEAPSSAPSMGPTMMLPPTGIENLDLLFQKLPDQTRASLMVENTPQSKAWDWLLRHRNVTNLPEWRKQQLFALATFYHAFEGPKWPQDIRKDWLNDTMEECLWINTSLQYLYGISATYLRTLQFDFKPCNNAGEIQTIALITLKLSRANPHVPPEIALLPSLAHLVLALSEIKAPLSAMLPQELYQVSNLDLFVLHGNTIHGTLPSDFGKMTAPRYLLFGANGISGTLPTELGLLSGRLLDLDLHQNDLIGTIPTELGSLRALTSLDLHWNDLEGSIPSELGLLTNLQELQLDGNSLTGSIPSELGLLQEMKRLHLQNNNDLSGAIPDELWSLTLLKDLGLSDLPMLSGAIPDELCYLQLDKNISSCSVFEGSEALPVPYLCSLNFDCTELLCGCHCPCSGGQNSTFL